MKILGFEISREKKPAEAKLSDAPVSVQKVPIPKTVPPALIPSVRTTALSYMADRGYGRGVFACPEYDLALIGRVEDTDGYVRQSFQKKTALMFKEGFDFVGSNKSTTQYIKIRLAQIAKATNIPTIELLRSLGNTLIKKSNAFLVKIRSEKASGGQRRVTVEGKKREPIAGYFVVPPETMEVDADEFGRVRRWRQRVPTGYYVDFQPEDILHFTFDKKEGFMFGTPTIVPVIDDIRALRKIEENVELLVYQYLFPLFHYKVGTETAPAGMTETGELEVDIVRREIQFMPSEGGIVTPERHEITMIGAEGRALQAEGYLTHFKQRVFSGLGISGVDMGEGDTANRATADNMSRALVDNVKDFQSVLETQFNHFVIQELLEESTFGVEVLNEENLVKLRFKEIDIDKRLKVEKHAREMFEGQGITWAELREIEGREAIAVPKTIDEDDPEVFIEWHDTSWKLFDEPKALIQAVDEPYSPAAQAAAQNPATSITPANVATAGDEQTAAEVTKIKAKPAPPAKKKDAVIHDFMTKMYTDLEENIIFNLQKGDKNKNYLRSIAEVQAGEMIKKLTSASTAAFARGYASKNTQSPSMEKFLSARKSMETRNTRYVTRLIASLVAALKRNIDSEISSANISLAHSVFSSLKYRIDLIEDVEIRRAYNFGAILGMQDRGVEQITFDTSDSNCERCTSSGKLTLDINKIDLDDIAPFHGNCSCRVKPVKQKEN